MSVRKKGVSHKTKGQLLRACIQDHPKGGFLPAGSLQFCRLYTMASALAAPPPADGFAGFRSAVVQSLKSTGTLDSLKVTHSPTSHASPAGVPCPRASSLCDDGARNAWMAF